MDTPITFTCSKCQEEKPIHTSGGTGYGENRETGAKTCYACCGKEFRAELVAAKPGDKFSCKF